MELKDLEKLMKVFEESDSREFKLDDGDFHLYLSKNKHHAPVEAPVQAAPAPAAAPAEPQAPAPVAKEAPGVSVKAPLVGTVYLQPKPGAPAFVKVGDRVEEGDVVCVIEAMKMMTEIKSDHAGIVSAINVKDGELVEVEQSLITLKED